MRGGERHPALRLRLDRWRLDDRAAVRLTWLVTALGLALRLTMVFIANDGRPDSPARLGGDELGYDTLARDLLAGLGFTWPGRVPL